MRAGFEPLTDQPIKDHGEGEKDFFPLAMDGFYKPTDSQADRSPLLVASPLDELNLNADQRDPSLSNDGLSLYFSTMLEGSPTDYDIWVAHRARINQKFAKPHPLPVINSEEGEFDPGISPDGLEIVWFRQEKIWYAKRLTLEDDFDPPRELSELNLGTRMLDPEFGGDGNTLYFSVDDQGKFTLYYSQRQAKEKPFASPLPVPGISSKGEVRDPSITSDGLSLFFAADWDASNAKEGCWETGGISLNIYSATRTSLSEPFSQPQLLKAINTEFCEENPEVSADSKILLFNRGNIMQSKLYQWVLQF